MEDIWNWFWTEKGYKYICFYIILFCYIITAIECDALRKENKRLQDEIEDTKNKKNVV